MPGMGVGRGVAVCLSLTVLTELPFSWGEIENKHMVLQVVVSAQSTMKQDKVSLCRVLRKVT